MSIFHNLLLFYVLFVKSQEKGIIISLYFDVIYFNLKGTNNCLLCFKSFSVFYAY